MLKKFNISFEEETIVCEPVNYTTALIDLKESQTENTIISNQINDAMVDSDTLDKLADVVESHIQVGLSPQAADALQIVTESIYHKYGMYSRNISSETFTEQSKSLYTKLAVEGISEAAAKLWRLIIEAIKKAYSVIVGFFKKVFAFLFGLEDKTKKVEKKIEDTDFNKEPKQKSMFTFSQKSTSENDHHSSFNEEAKKRTDEIFARMKKHQDEIDRIMKESNEEIRKARAEESSQDLLKEAMKRFEEAQEQDRKLKKEKEKEILKEKLREKESNSPINISKNIIEDLFTDKTDLDSIMKTTNSLIKQLSVMPKTYSKVSDCMLMVEKMMDIYRKNESFNNNNIKFPSFTTPDVLINASLYEHSDITSTYTGELLPGNKCLKVKGESPDYEATGEDSIDRMVQTQITITDWLPKKQKAFDIEIPVLNKDGISKLLKQSKQLNDVFKGLENPSENLLKNLDVLLKRCEDFTKAYAFDEKTHKKNKIKSCVHAITRICSISELVSIVTMSIKVNSALVSYANQHVDCYESK